MDELLNGLLAAGVIDPDTAEIIRRQSDPDAARAWAEERLLTATQSSLAAQQERALTLLRANDYAPTDDQQAAFWSDEDERLGASLLPAIREVAAERAAVAAVRSGLPANVFSLINQDVLDWVDDYYTNADGDENAFGSLPSLNLTARTRFALYFSEWQTGELGGRPDGLPQLINALTPVFGPVRAESIAVTETTRIFVQSQRLVEARNPRTVAFRWLTAADERVCPICGPRHGQVRRKEQGYEGADIPAHTRCRCDETPETTATLAMGVPPEERWMYQPPAVASQDGDGPQQVRRQIAATSQRIAAQIDNELAAFKALSPRLAAIQERRNVIKRSLEDATGAEQARLQQQLKAIDDEVTTLLSQRQSHINAASRLKSERSDAIRRLVESGNPSNIQLGQTNTELGAIWTDGVSTFNRLVDRNAFADFTVGLQRIAEGQRAYATDTNIALAPSDKAWVVIHELGHILERQAPGVLDKALAFYDRRTAGEALAPIGGNYDTSEVTRRDRFIDPYMGKDYNRTATEVVSMGVQLLATAPERLATEDPDYFDFMYNLLRGR